MYRVWWNRVRDYDYTIRQMVGPILKDFFWWENVLRKYYGMVGLYFFMSRVVKFSFT